MSTNIMRAAFLLLTGVTTSFLLQAQDPKEMAGSYYMEAANDAKSGFNLSSNSTFNFFYTKNGIDRFGSGRWFIEKNTIVFSSRRKPSKVYSLLSSRRVNDNFVTVTFTDDNPELVKNIECILFTERGRQRLFTKNDGMVRFTKQTIDSIQIRSLLFPDHPFTLIPGNKLQNSFEFAFEKSVFEVFFEDFALSYVDGLMMGPHPLLKGNYRYVRSEE